jgi:hypothetical protein
MALPVAEDLDVHAFLNRPRDEHPAQ